MTPELNKRYFKHYNEHFTAIYIHPDSLESETAKRFQNLFPDKIRPYSEITASNNTNFMASEDFSQSKKKILIQKYEGKFFKQCPGSGANTACCNYFVLNLGSQCHFNCSYCYLQSFLNVPYMVVYSNVDDALEELYDIAKKSAHQSLRVGTGELIDSLGLDPITQFSEKIMEKVKDFPNLALEIKTKSDFVDHLLDLPHKGSTVVSWSINPDHIIEIEEHGTASLEKRLMSAKKCLDAGYSISFHIDPVIWHPEWKLNYGNLIEKITAIFGPSDVPFISLGALRFQPEQRHIMKERFDRGSHVNSAELFQSKDGKLRYDSGLRSEMFKFIINGFKENNRAWRVFLCMESPETWLSTYGKHPMKVDGLQDLFSPRGH